jgi:hypothetical protein
VGTASATHSRSVGSRYRVAVVEVLPPERETHWGLLLGFGLCSLFWLVVLLAAVAFF